MNVGLVVVYCCAMMCATAVLIYLVERFINRTMEVGKATFLLTKDEADGGYVRTNRLPDAGGWICVEHMSDQEFFHNVTVIWNGLVCANNRKSVSGTDSADFEFDVARQLGTPQRILFSKPDNDVLTTDEEDVVQVIVYR